MVFYDWREIWDNIYFLVQDGEQKSAHGNPQEPPRKGEKILGRGKDLQKNRRQPEIDGGSLETRALSSQKNQSEGSWIYDPEVWEFFFWVSLREGVRKR